ncbi:putative nuclease HARBI1, partial [Temnothorax curvispinosus]|uniref:Nuclease HARBI1 n=1 Tax=Temnothorax curvispinosus TaxID=300111 RepID=A0A6J1Q2Q9_9HYME
MAFAHVLSSSDDEGFADMVNRRPNNVRRQPAYFYKFDDVDFHARFRNNAISSMYQLLLAFRFYVTGSYLISAGDFSGVSKTSAHRVVHRVTNAIARLRPRFIKFPTFADEIKTEQIKFFDIARFPRVVGCIDCTHIKIQLFGGNDAEYFRNRKGYFSINVQAICNVNLQITDLVA